MSRETLLEATCDRCGAAAMVRQEEAARKLDLWGRVYAARCDGNDIVGTNEAPADLCGSCLFELVEFMNGAKLAAPASAVAAE